MCGIAGLIHRNGVGDIGQEMTAMLQSLKHRGPDSTGFALYGEPGRNEYVMRFKVAEQEDLDKGFDIHDQVKHRRAKVDRAPEEPRRQDRSARTTPRNTPSATASSTTAT